MHTTTPKRRLSSLSRPFLTFMKRRQIGREHLRVSETAFGMEFANQSFGCFPVF
ncbi:hypothetical protein [Yellowstone lake phycodnavirus 2]|uniref:hypothetical protein n=1 Tax=Yellowstone lake phycodnavirus 2 TaxID=1586714 RepID=UPI0006EBB447|nr:hypothetical protein AR678_gp003 [Yellowstone lake phycodnavirus 2]BAT22277.1 hypothetical protein [Yellowstone lake phycodnavirus 2]